LFAIVLAVVVVIVKVWVTSEVAEIAKCLANSVQGNQKLPAFLLSLEPHLPAAEEPAFRQAPQVVAPTPIFAPLRLCVKSHPFRNFPLRSPTLISPLLHKPITPESLRANA